MHDLAMTIESKLIDLDNAKQQLDARGDEVLRLRGFLDEIICDYDNESPSDLQKTIRLARQYLMDSDPEQEK